MRPLRAMMLVSLALLAGCVTVGADQLDSFRRALPETDPAIRAASPYAWDLRFAGMSYTVYPASTGDGRLIFGSVEGIRIHWDGSAVYRVEGLPGALGLLQSGVEGGERWFARDGGATIRLGCAPRRDWRLSAVQQGWRVECVGEAEGRRLSATLVAEFEGVGQLRRLEATVIPGVAPMVLIRRR